MCIKASTAIVAKDRGLEGQTKLTSQESFPLPNFSCQLCHSRLCHTTSTSLPSQEDIMSHAMQINWLCMQMEEKWSQHIMVATKTSAFCNLRHWSIVLFAGMWAKRRLTSSIGSLTLIAMDSWAQRRPLPMRQSSGTPSTVGRIDDSKANGLRVALLKGELI